MDFEKAGLNVMHSGKPEDEVKQTSNISLPDAPDVVQKEIMRWNWGAFLLGWIWALGNRLWIWALIGLAAIAIAFIPSQNNKTYLISLICQAVISVFLGVKGNEWAWKSKKWDSIEQFKKTQGKWRRWGIVATILGFIIGVIIGLIFPA